MAQITLKNRALFINHLLFFLKASTTTRLCASSSCLSSPPRQALPFQFLSPEFVALGGVSLLFPDCQHPVSLDSDRLGQDGDPGRILTALNDGL